MSNVPDWFAAVDAAPGSRWIRCALQVNPFGYVRRHAVATSYEDQASYDQAIAQALRAAEVEVVAVTDHFRIQESESLLHTLRAEGITALPSFEANTSEGVHLLVLFEESVPTEHVRDAIKRCDLHNPEDDSPISRLSATQLMAAMHDAGAVCLGAHVTMDNGILKSLSGSARIQAWTSPHLSGVAIPGAVDHAPESIRAILRNDDAKHHRPHALAIVNAGDISKPEDAVAPGTTVLLRMTEPCLRGARHALADPESRVRLNSDPEPVDRPVIRAVHWDGGYLDGQTVILSERLNVLVGAPGAGKSTIIESIRAAFGLAAHGELAAEAFKHLTQAALSSATISVVVEHPSPTPSRVVIRRTFPHPPEVLDWETFEPSGRRVEDLDPLPEVYGQHEIAELSQDEAKRTQVLRRFVTPDADLDAKVDRLGTELREADKRLEEAEQSVEELSATAQLLPGIEAELKKWEELGIAEKLKESTTVDREHRYLQRLENYVDGLAADLAGFRKDLAQVPSLPTELNGVPFEAELLDGQKHAQTARDSILTSIASADGTIVGHRDALEAIRVKYKARRASVEAALTAVRESLGPNVSAAEFSDLQRRADLAREAQRDLPAKKSAVAELEKKRRSALIAREEALAEQTRKLKKAANKVNAQLKRVRVHVESGPDLDAFRSFAAEQLKGFRGQSHEVLAGVQNLSFRGLAEACRAGEAAVEKVVKLTPGDVRRLAGLDAVALRALEALSPRTVTQIELDVALTGSAVWRKIEDLSRGQKATAVLLLLLLPTEAPLIVDQPEDDLDNRFIVESVVPALRATKADRQYLFATHNANVPVLADAELIAGLTAADAAGSGGHAVVRPEDCGALDRESVRDLVERQLEGGRDAFDERRRRYGR